MYWLSAWQCFLTFGRKRGSEPFCLRNATCPEICQNPCKTDQNLGRQASQPLHASCQPWQNSTKTKRRFFKWLRQPSNTCEMIPNTSRNGIPTVYVSKIYWLGAFHAWESYELSTNLMKFLSCGGWIIHISSIARMEPPSSMRHHAMATLSRPMHRRNGWCLANGFHRHVRVCLALQQLFSSLLGGQILSFPLRSNVEA